MGFKAYFGWFVLLVLLPFLHVLIEPLEPLLTGELQKVQNLVDGLEITIPIYVKFGDAGLHLPDLIDAAQIQLDSELATYNTSLKFKLVDNLKEPPMDPNCEEIQLEDDYVLILHLGSSDSAIIHQRFSHVVLIYMLSTVHSNDLPYFVVQTLLDYLLYADLHPYQYEELDEQIPIEVIQVSSGSGNSYEAVAEMCSEGFNRFSNNIFNVTAKYSKVAKSQVSPQPHRFYFEVLDTGTPKTEELPAGIPNDSVFQLVLPADSMLNNETTGKFEAFFDDIYASLASELPVSIHPSNNVNIRLGALLKHSVLRNINKILDRLAQNPHHPAQKPILANVRGFISQLQQYPVPWKRLHQETTNTLKSTCL